MSGQLVICIVSGIWNGHLDSNDNWSLNDIDYSVGNVRRTNIWRNTYLLLCSAVWSFLVDWDTGFRWANMAGAPDVAKHGTK